jgi:hypothetical protein
MEVCLTGSGGISNHYNSPLTYCSLNSSSSSISSISSSSSISSRSSRRMGRESYSDSAYDDSYASNNKNNDYGYTPDSYNFHGSYSGTLFGNY